MTKEEKLQKASKLVRDLVESTRTIDLGSFIQNISTGIVCEILTDDEYSEENKGILINWGGGEFTDVLISDIDKNDVFNEIHLEDIMRAKQNLHPLAGSDELCEIISRYDCSKPFTEQPIILYDYVINSLSK